MPYVMVPVPEEHVEEAMHAVLRISARASVSDWDVESIDELFGSLDEASKSVISAVARGAIVRGSIPDHDVAKVIEISQREVLGIVREVNEVATQSQHPNLIGVQMVTENLPNGRTHEQRMLVMTKPVAELIRAAEKAEQDAAPHPLLGGQG